MYTDSLGLPVQQDGDAGDQLQRCGMLLVGEALNTKMFNISGSCKIDTGIDPVTLDNGVFKTLQISPGVYTRCNGAPTTDTSGDQLVPIFATTVVYKYWSGWLWLCIRMLIRLGFAQNYRDDAGKLKVPDYMLFRVLPIVLRIHWVFYPLLFIVDLSLILLAITASASKIWEDGVGFAPRSPDDVDDNNTIITLAVCANFYPTFISKFAWNRYKADRPLNNGNIILGWKDAVVGALFWYHRPESGGNVEVARLYRSVVTGQW